MKILCKRQAVLWMKIILLILLIISSSGKTPWADSIALVSC